MPTRSKGPRRPRVSKPLTLVKGPESNFGVSRTTGHQVEWRFRRMHPLSDDDIAVLHKHIRTVIRQHRLAKYPWFFVSIRVSVKGGFYQVKFVPNADDEDKWESQWISTKVNHDGPGNRSSDVDVLIEDFDDLVTGGIELHLRGRMAFITGIRVVFIRNHTAHERKFK